MIQEYAQNRGTVGKDLIKKQYLGNKLRGLDIKELVQKAKKLGQRVLKIFPMKHCLSMPTNLF